MSFELMSARIDSLQAKYDAAENRLSRLEAKPLNAKRAARIQDLEERQANWLERIESFTDKLPKDEFSASFWVDPVTGENYGVSVTVTDSPYDDTYVGGTSLDMSVSGRGYYNGTGFSGFNHNRGYIMSDEYAPVDDTKTVGFSLDPLRLNGAYPELSVSMRDSSTGDVVWSEQLITDGVQLI